MEDLKTEIEQIKIQLFTGIKLGRIEEEWGNMVIDTCDRALTIHGVVKSFDCGNNRVNGDTKCLEQCDECKECYN
jgi:hypothetical protein